MIPNVLPVGQVADETQRRCYDCAHLKAAVSWWCTSDDAAKWRRTKLPGIRDCPYWAPAPTEEPAGPSAPRRWLSRLFGA